MGQGLAFDHAVSAWRKPLEDEDQFDAVAAIEALILRHQPTSAGESVAMLDLVISEYECGPRCDALDRLALTAVRDWLHGEAYRGV